MTKHTHVVGEKKDAERSRKVSRLIAPLLLRLGIAQQWSLRVCFHDRLRANTALPDSKGRYVTARCSSEYPYRVINIELDRDTVDNFSDHDLVKMLLHEILHIVPLAPLSRYGEALLGKDTTNDGWWMCLEEEVVEILTLWISQLWLDLEEYREKATAASSHGSTCTKRSKASS